VCALGFADVLSRVCCGLQMCRDLLCMCSSVYVLGICGGVRMYWGIHVSFRKQIYAHICKAVCIRIHPVGDTGWRRYIKCLKLQVSFHNEKYPHIRRPTGLCNPIAECMC